MPDTPTQVVIPLFGGVTQLDFTEPHQVFSRVSRRGAEREEHDSHPPKTRPARQPKNP